MQQVSLYFNTKNARKMGFKNCHTIGLFQLLKSKSTKEIADMFSLKIRIEYNIVFHAEREGRRDLKGYELKEKLLKPFMTARNSVQEDELFKWQKP